MCAVSSHPTTLPTLSCGFRHADHGDDHDLDDLGVGNHDHDLDDDDCGDDNEDNHEGQDHSLGGRWDPN